MALNKRNIEFNMILNIKLLIEFQIKRKASPYLGNAFLFSIFNEAYFHSISAYLKY